MHGRAASRAGPEAIGAEGAGDALDGTAYLVTCAAVVVVPLVLAAVGALRLSERSAGALFAAFFGLILVGVLAVAAVLL